MKLTRRGFLGGVFAALATRVLPKVKREPTPVIVPVEEPPLPRQWEQLIYGTGIIYTSGLIRRDVQ